MKSLRKQQKRVEGEKNWAFHGAILCTLDSSLNFSYFLIACVSFFMLLISSHKSDEILHADGAV